MAALTAQSGNEMATGGSKVEPPRAAEDPQVVVMAERQGFEPWNTCEDVTGIPVQRLRPLGHLSSRREGYTAVAPAIKSIGGCSGEGDAGGLQGLEDGAVQWAGQRHERQPDTVADQAHARGGPFDRDGIALQEH